MDSFLWCSGCCGFRPVAEFARSNTIERGYQTYCRKCSRAYQRNADTTKAWREQHKAELLAAARAAYAERLKDPVYRERQRAKWRDAEKKRAAKRGSSTRVEPSEPALRKAEAHPEGEQR